MPAAASPERAPHRRQRPRTRQFRALAADFVAVDVVQRVFEHFVEYRQHAVEHVGQVVRDVFELVGDAGFLRRGFVGHRFVPHSVEVDSDRRSQKGRARRSTTSVLSSITEPVLTGLRLGLTAEVYSSG